MKTDFKTNRRKSPSSILLAVLAAPLILAPVAAMADDPITMAPPVASAGSEGGSGGEVNASQSVFNWSEVPASQRVPVTRATFDAGGYQIYDNVGETIMVPFRNDNLYVMKFAVSDNGSMYFVNDGDEPVLYVPQGGYLENATVGGARWYPFSQSFHPRSPVFVGIAPSWNAYVGMGWYPGMYCWGGYWGSTPYISGGIFVPMIGFSFFIGGHPYYGWGSYHSYYLGHPGWYHPSFYRRDYYHWASHPSLARPPFGAVAHPAFGRGGFGGGGHHFAGAGGGGGFHGGGSGGFHGIAGGGHATSAFRGAGGGGGSFHGAGGGGGFHGGGGTGGFHGASSSHSFGGGAGSVHGSGGGHSFGGGGGGHSFGGGSGGHSFGGGSGGHSSGGGHSFGGGGHSSDKR